MFTLPVYEYTPPAELRSGTPALHPVVVVGGGLTGLSVALDLVKRGVPVVVLDDDNTVGVKGLASRGMCWAQRTLDIFERLGVAEAIRAKGVTWNVGRVLSGDVPVASFQLQAQPDLRHNGFANLQQYYVEQFLVEALQREPLAELRWLNKVHSLRLDDERVVLEVDTPEGRYSTHAQYVVACDGANSGIRQALGLSTTVHDKTEDRWIIIDIVLREGDFPPERWTWLDARANHGRAVWRHKMADDTWRLDFQLNDHEDTAKALTPEAMRQRVQNLLGPDIAFDIAWHGTWQYRHECMPALRHGRVLFAGDAAHLVAPFGARGGNGGVQDSDNLAWKLALHLSGEVGVEILDSYSRERIQGAHDNIRQALRSSRFVYPLGHASAQLWRQAIMDLAPQQPEVARFINTGRLSNPSQYAPSDWVSEVGSGFALPNVRLKGQQGAADAVHLHELLGPWFTLLVFADALPADCAAGADAVLIHAVAVGAHCDAEGRAALARQLPQATPGSVWLLRPDQHVMSLHAKHRAHAQALLAQALQAPTSHCTERDHHAHTASA